MVTVLFRIRFRGMVPIRFRFQVRNHGMVMAPVKDQGMDKDLVLGLISNHRMRTENPRIAITIRLPADLVAWLRANHPDGQGRYIEDCIRAMRSAHDDRPAEYSIDSTGVVK